MLSSICSASHRLNASKENETIKHPKHGDLEGIRCLGIAGDGHTMVSGSTDKETELDIWEKPQGEKKWKLRQLEYHGKRSKPEKKLEKLQALAISRDGNMFISGHNNSQIVVWKKPNPDAPSGKGWKREKKKKPNPDASSGKGSKREKDQAPISQDVGFDDKGIALTFFAVAISKDEKQFAVGTQSDIYLCNFPPPPALPQSQQQPYIHKLEGNKARVTAISYIPNKNEIISSSYDYNVILWNIDPSERNCIRIFTHVRSCEFIYPPKSPPTKI